MLSCATGRLVLGFSYSDAEKENSFKPHAVVVLQLAAPVPVSYLHSPRIISKGVNLAGCERENKHNLLLSFRYDAGTV